LSGQGATESNTSNHQSSGVGEQDESNDNITIDPMEENDLVSDNWDELEKHQKSGWDNCAKVYDDADLVDLARVVGKAFTWSGTEHRNRCGGTKDIVEVHVRRSSEKEAKECT